MSVRRFVLDVLRIPHDPSAPAGDENVRVFRAAPAYQLYRLSSWALKNGAAAIGLYIGLRFALGFTGWLGGDDLDIPAGDRVIRLTITGVRVIEVVAITSFIAQAIAGLVLIRLDFENRWYLVSNRSLRIREGLLRLSEQTMTFANVQNVGIRQGPLQRILGIADLEVRTAGGGADTHALGTKEAGTHVAYFRGISDANLVRDVIRERLRLHRDAGLGDPDDPSHDVLPEAASTPDLLSAALSLADEARALRRVLTPGL